MTLLRDAVLVRKIKSLLLRQGEKTGRDGRKRARSGFKNKARGCGAHRVTRPTIPKARRRLKRADGKGRNGPVAVREGTVWRRCAGPIDKSARYCFLVVDDCARLWDVFGIERLYYVWNKRKRACGSPRAGFLPCGAGYWGAMKGYLECKDYKDGRDHRDDREWSNPESRRRGGGRTSRFLRERGKMPAIPCGRSRSVTPSHGQSRSVTLKNYSPPGVAK